jgi:hypothetical protein
MVATGNAGRYRPIRDSSIAQSTKFVISPAVGQLARGDSTGMGFPSGQMSECEPTGNQSR